MRPRRALPPYKGLLFFDQADAGLFFGREALTAHLADRVTDLAMDASSRFLAVVGASGSGKSSLVRAGLAVDASTRRLENSHLHSYRQPVENAGGELQPDPAQITARTTWFWWTNSKKPSPSAGTKTSVRHLLKDCFPSPGINRRKRRWSSPCAQIFIRTARSTRFCATAVAAEQEYIGQMTARRTAPRHRRTRQTRRLGI